MTQPFDHYYKWLGIPTEEQPPDYYRLLGLRPFEDDPDVIDMAADRQMSHIRSLSAGKHASLAQQLLNDLSSARVCLLDSATKASYDQQLRATASPPQVGANHESSVPEPMFPSASQVNDATNVMVDKGFSKHVQRRRAANWGAIISIAAVAFLGVCVAVIVLWPPRSQAPIRTVEAKGDARSDLDSQPDVSEVGKSPPRRSQNSEAKPANETEIAKTTEGKQSQKNDVDGKSSSDDHEQPASSPPTAPQKKTQSIDLIAPFSNGTRSASLVIPHEMTKLELGVIGSHNSFPGGLGQKNAGKNALITVDGRPIIRWIKSYRSGDRKTHNLLVAFDGSEVNTRLPETLEGAGWDITSLVKPGAKIDVTYRHGLRTPKLGVRIRIHTAPQSQPDAEVVEKLAETEEDIQERLVREREEALAKGDIAAALQHEESLAARKGINKFEAKAALLLSESFPTSVKNLPQARAVHFIDTVESALDAEQVAFARGQKENLLRLAREANDAQLLKRATRIFLRIQSLPVAGENR